MAWNGEGAKSSHTLWGHRALLSHLHACPFGVSGKLHSSGTTDLPHRSQSLLIELSAQSLDPRWSWGVGPKLRPSNHKVGSSGHKPTLRIFQSHFINIMGERKFSPLLPWVLAAGLIIKLTEDTLTGERERNFSAHEGLTEVGPKIGQNRRLLYLDKETITLRGIDWKKKLRFWIPN